MSELGAVLKDRYEIDRELGRGGMSVVYLARDRQLLSKLVVVKVLQEEMSADAWGRKKFLQEMEALARIDHPGVVGALDTGETPDGKRFLVMQYVEGVTLRKALQPAGMSFPRVTALIRQIAGALAAAHDKGVWHRDLKPENIMLQTLGDGEEHVKLIDFGIAGITDSAFGGEKTRNAVGTLTYMAPEQSQGKGTAASDIYALGVVTYEMVTGQIPFAADSILHVVSAKYANVKPPRELRADLPDAAAQSILKAMSFAAEDRHARVRDFSEELTQALTAAPAEAPPPRPRPAQETAHALCIGFIDPRNEYSAQLQQIVHESPRFQGAEADGDVVSLSTPGGTTLAFFGDPSAAAQCALDIAAGLRGRPQLKLRMGIHAGPVSRDDANVTGEAIDAARSVMERGDAGKILISKTAAGLLPSHKWAPYLTDLGDIYSLTAQPQVIGGESKQRRTRLPWWALAPALAIIGAVAAWYFLRSSPVRQLNYSITVQRFRDGEPYENPFRLPGEMVFEQGYGIAFELAATQHGYLYVLDEEPAGENGARGIVLLEPRGAASAEQAPAAAIRIPPKWWFQFDKVTGTETCYLVWADAPVPELERVKALPAGMMGVVRVEDQGAVKQLHNFLVKLAAQKVTVTRNEAQRQTELRTTAKILAHPIRLEHQ
jgi:serine/threonine protein kinase